MTFAVVAILGHFSITVMLFFISQVHNSYCPFHSCLAWSHAQDRLPKWVHSLATLYLFLACLYVVLLHVYIRVDSQIIVTAHMQFGKLFIIHMNLHKSFKPLTHSCVQNVCFSLVLRLANLKPPRYATIVTKWVFHIWPLIFYLYKPHPLIEGCGWLS